jgi:hypothetical protein
MTNQPSNYGAEKQAVDLQVLTFRQKGGHSDKLVFRSEIRPDNMADAPGLALTVTVDSPGEDQDKREELDAFLGEMRVGITVAAEDQAAVQERWFELELVEPREVMRPVVTTMTIEATVKRGCVDMWVARYRPELKAMVTVISGKVTVGPYPTKTITSADGSYGPVIGQPVTVKGVHAISKYRISSPWIFGGSDPVPKPAPNTEPLR